MIGLTPLGIVHTAISLIAVAAGIIALVRYRAISLGNLVGQVYVITTILTCVTGFGIFKDGRFGIAHVLGVVTLAVLALAAVAGKTRRFGRASPYVETVSYSATLFFHMIPAFTETATRFPIDAPLAANDQAPGLQAAIGACFVVFLFGAALNKNTTKHEIGRAHV